MNEIPEGIHWGLKPRQIEAEGPMTTKAAADRFDLVPRDKWVDVFNDGGMPLYDQLDGHCASNAACYEVQRLRAKQGLSQVVGCPEILYATHSNWGTGSTLPENLEALSTIGVPSRNSCPQRNYGRVRDYGRYADEALVYRVLEWLDCQGDVDWLGSGLQKGFTGPIGCDWPGGGGHSVHCDSMTLKKGVWYFGGRNSWGTKPGPTGRWELSLDYLEDRRRGNMVGYGAWVGYSVVHDEWTGAGSVA